MVWTLITEILLITEAQVLHNGEANLVSLDVKLSERVKVFKIDTEEVSISYTDIDDYQQI